MEYRTGRRSNRGNSRRPGGEGRVDLQTDWSPGMRPEAAEDEAPGAGTVDAQGIRAAEKPRRRDWRSTGLDRHHRPGTTVETGLRGECLLGFCCLCKHCRRTQMQETEGSRLAVQII